MGLAPTLARWSLFRRGETDGLDQYQVRNFGAIYKDIAFVAVTFSLLKAAQADSTLLISFNRISRLSSMAQQELGTETINTSPPQVYLPSILVAKQQERRTCSPVKN
jgi:hypothetical protein